MVFPTIKSNEKQYFHSAENIKIQSHSKEQ